MNNILIIVGPTASGKSDLAVKLAKKFKGEIISADSRQVYKGLDVGTGKITRKEMKGIRHHLLDVADPRKQFSVVEYQKLASRAIENIADRGKLPIIVGGTGFYIEALIDGVILPDVPANDALRKKLGKGSASELFGLLKKLDPGRSRSIDPKNSRRLIRAIEIATVLGKVPKIRKFPNKKYHPIFIGLNVLPAELKKKIKRRLTRRLIINKITRQPSMITEARRLHGRGLTWQRMEELGLEYRYLAHYLQGKMTRPEMIKELSTEIWYYAKRQLTWFRRDKRITWLNQPYFTNSIERITVRKAL